MYIAPYYFTLNYSFSFLKCWLTNADAPLAVSWNNNRDQFPKRETVLPEHLWQRQELHSDQTALLNQMLGQRNLFVQESPISVTTITILQNHYKHWVFIRTTFNTRWDPKNSSKYPKTFNAVLCLPRNCTGFSKVSDA